MYAHVFACVHMHVKAKDQSLRIVLNYSSTLFIEAGSLELNGLASLASLLALGIFHPCFSHRQHGKPTPH